MKFPIKSLALSALLYVGYQYGVTLLAALIATIPSIVVASVTGDIFIRVLTVFIAETVLIMIGLFVLFYNDGYRRNVSYDKSNKFTGFIISLICSYVIYYLLGVLTKFFFIFSTDGLGFLLMGVDNVRSLPLGEQAVVPFGDSTLAFLILLVPVAVLSVLGFKIGHAKRQKDRAKMTQNKVIT